MRSLLLLFCFAFGAASAHAELIDGPANVRDERSRSVIISLDDSVYVEASRPQNGWFYIERLAWVRAEDAQSSQRTPEQLTLRVNALLFDESGRRIGQMKQAFDFPFVRERGGMKQILLYGLTTEQNIRTCSAPEQDFMLERRKLSGRSAIADWSDYMQRHGFRENLAEGGIIVFTKQGIGMLGTADHRVSLVFANGKLAAVLASWPDQLEELPFEALTDEIQIHFTGHNSLQRTQISTLLRKHFQGAG